MVALGRRRFAILSGGAFLLALLLGLLVSFVWERGQLDARVVRGVNLGERSLSGLDRAALEHLFTSERSALVHRRVTLSLEGEEWSSSAGELGFDLSVEKHVDDALARGRPDSFVFEFVGWIPRLFGDEELAINISSDSSLLEEKVAKWAATIIAPPKEPSISFDKKLLVEESRGGTRVLFEQLQQELSAAVREQKEIELDLSVRQSEPQVPAALVEKRRKEAEALLSKRITFTSPDGEVSRSLSVKSLGAALSSEVSSDGADLVLLLSVTSLRKSLAPLLKKVERLPVDADFEFPSRGEPKILESEMGQVLDEEQLVSDIWKASQSSSRKIALKVKESAPKLSTEEAASLGVKKLVSRFTTRHPCCRPRVKNIHRAAELLSGVVLRPGQRFSLNELLGPRTAASGYVAAPTIVRGKMKDVHGGGISQLATTLFNAVLRGGYEIVQRQPHSVYFPRYPEGHEATVSFPEPDLIFKNDTKAGMVIKTQFTGTFISVLIYGDDEGRITTVSKSKRYKIVEPPKEYEADPEYEPEEEKRLRAGQLGWTLLVTRRVKSLDGEIKEESREVVYNARPELLRVHPCMIPEDADGHTGEECPEPEEEEREEELSEDTYYETGGGEPEEGYEEEGYQYEEGEE